MHSRELINLIKANGYEHVGGKGSHRKYRNKDGNHVTVPHPVKDIPVGTLKSILKKAGLEDQDPG